MKRSPAEKKAAAVPNPAVPTAKGRRYVRKGNVLRYAVTPKTCGSLAARTVRRVLPVAAMRAIYIFCGLLFIGAGMYNMLF